MRTIGIVTGGGDAPGLHAVIRAAVKTAVGEFGMRVVGIEDSFEGLLGETHVRELKASDVRGLLPRGGTILGTRNRGSFVVRQKDGTDMMPDEVYQEALDNLERLSIDAVVAIGGEGTLAIAYEFHRRGVPVVAVPKTIDNDLAATELTFGFMTALDISTEALDRLHTTAESHDRVMVLEVMGRHAGWIAAYGGIAGGADVIIVPEHPFKLSRVCELLNHRKSQGSAFSIVVAAEDARPHPDEDFLGDEVRSQIYQHGRLGGIGYYLAREIERETGIETRHANLGYVQRGGSPSAFDRVLATRFGVKAFEMILEKRWGQMVSLRGNKMACVPLDDAVRRIKYLDEEIYHVAEVFFH